MPSRARFRAFGRLPRHLRTWRSRAKRTRSRSYAERVSETSAPNRPLREQLFTWANLVSILRLACVPLFVWLLLAEDRRLAAAGLLAFVGATDWVDGYLARRLNQVSDVGKILDPKYQELVDEEQNLNARFASSWTT